MSMGANGSPGSSIQQMPILFLALLHCSDEQESVEWKQWFDILNLEDFQFFHVKCEVSLIKAFFFAYQLDKESTSILDF